MALSFSPWTAPSGASAFAARTSTLRPRRCDSYESRPGVCRDYPRNLLIGTKPELFESCGYRIVDLQAASLRAELESLDLSPAQRALLERRLYLGGPSTSESAGGEAGGPFSV